MSHLLPVGTHTAQVVEVRPGPAHTRLSFESPDGGTAFQSLPNDVMQNGLAMLGVADARQLKGHSCAIRVEQVFSSYGVQMSRATECQWLNRPVSLPQHPPMLA